MRRNWRRSPGQTGLLGLEIHYGLGRDVLYEKETFSSLSWESDAWITIGGVKIASIHRSQTYGTEIVYVQTDRMGTPRVFLQGPKSANEPGNGQLYGRVMVDPWGRGNTVTHVAAEKVPFTHHRNPGQVEDVALGLVENGYRVMVPELGQYTGADPLHQAQTMTSW